METAIGEALANIIKLSPVVALLLAVVWVMWKKVQGYEAKAEAREETNRMECKARETQQREDFNKMNAAAQKEKADLADRLRVVEDRNNEQLFEVARESSQAITGFTKALDRWATARENESGIHKVKNT